MYTLVRSLTIRQFLYGQLPVLALSLGIAELFFKFHSFLIEACAFIATWFVLDFLVGRVLRVFRPEGNQDSGI